MIKECYILLHNSKTISLFYGNENVILRWICWIYELCNKIHYLYSRFSNCFTVCKPVLISTNHIFYHIRCYSCTYLYRWVYIPVQRNKGGTLSCWKHILLKFWCSILQYWWKCVHQHIMIWISHQVPIFYTLPKNIIANYSCPHIHFLWSLCMPLSHPMRIVVITIMTVMFTHTIIKNKDSFIWK